MEFKQSPPEFELVSLGTIHKSIGTKGLEEMENGEKIETIQNTA